jgi:hypothetical protein
MWSMRANRNLTLEVPMYSNAARQRSRSCSVATGQSPWLAEDRMEFDQLKRREFITLVGGAAVL